MIGQIDLPRVWIQILPVSVRILVLCCLGLASSPVFGFEAAAGFSMVEQGDDQQRPAASLHIGYNPFYQSRIHLWGRQFGPVTERSFLLSTSRRFGLFRSKTFSGSIGLAVLDEAITIDFEGVDDDDDEYDRSEHNYNVGAAFGISAELVDAGNLYLSANWDSHIFPAGQGFIVLVTARKQTLSVVMGAKL